MRAQAPPAKRVGAASERAAAAVVYRADRRGEGGEAAAEQPAEEGRIVRGAFPEWR